MSDFNPYREALNELVSLIREQEEFGSNWKWRGRWVKACEDAKTLVREDQPDEL